MRESNFQLIGKPVVTKSLFELNNEFDFQGDIALEIDNNIEIIKLENQPMESIIRLTLGFFTKSDFKKVPFKIEMKIEGHFKWDEELDEKEALLETMLKENAPAILYSYLRPLITSLTMEADLPPLIIPLMNFRN